MCKPHYNNIKQPLSLTSDSDSDSDSDDDDSDDEVSSSESSFCTTDIQISCTNYILR